MSLKEKFEKFGKDVKSDIKNIEKIIHMPLYRPFSSFELKKLEKLEKKNKKTKEIKPKEYKPPKKKIKGMGVLKSFTKVLLVFAVYTACVEFYLAQANKEQTLTNDFDTENSIKDENGNNIETDENGQINPFPVTDEEKQAVIEKITNSIAQDAQNYGVKDKIVSIDAVSVVQINQVATSGTFSNYLYSIRFSTTSNTYDMQFWADNLFAMSEEEKSDIDKLNEFYNFILSPDNCALFNIAPMSESSIQIKNVLNERGNNVAFVGETIWATANSGDIIYKIPVYNQDGTTVVWTSTIQSTPQIDALGLTAEEALLKQFSDGTEYFSPINQSQQNVAEIQEILTEFQTDLSESQTQASLASAKNKTKGYVEIVTLAKGDSDEYVLLNDPDGKYFYHL